MQWETTESEEDLLSMGQMQLILNGLRERYRNNLLLKLDLDSVQQGLDKASATLLRVAKVDHGDARQLMIN